jgi:phosphate transport system substrate-binding protein
MSTRALLILSTSLCLSAVGAACSAPEPAGAPIVIDGSSTVHPIADTLATEYRKKHSTQTITLTSSSTGVGLKRFCAGELDVANASRNITDAESAACAQAGVTFIELPIAYDAISIVVNPANSWATSITVPELKKLWEPAAEGKIKRWSQVRAGWPDKEIHLVGPDAESGTFDYFNQSITGAPKSSRKDYAANVDDNKIISAVEADELALGYLGFTYFEKEHGKVKALALDDLNEQIAPGPVELTVKNVRRGVYLPLSRPLFVYVKSQSIERHEVQQFMEFYLRFSADMVDRIGGIRLAQRESELAIDRLMRRVPGTMFSASDEGDISLEMRLSKK